MTQSPAPESTNPQNRQPKHGFDSDAKTHNFSYSDTNKVFFSFFSLSLPRRSTEAEMGGRRATDI